MRFLSSLLISLFLFGCTPENNKPGKPDHPRPNEPGKEIRGIASLLTAKEWSEGWEVWSNSMLGQKPHIIVRRESFLEAHHVALRPKSMIDVESGKNILYVVVEEAVGIQTKNVLRLDYECDPSEYSKVIILLPSGQELEFADFVRTE